MSVFWRVGGVTRVHVPTPPAEPPPERSSASEQTPTIAPIPRTGLNLAIRQDDERRLLDGLRRRCSRPVSELRQEHPLLLIERPQDLDQDVL